MTVTTTGYRKAFSGNGVTTAFATDFVFLAETELVVTLVASDGTETVQTITTNYTVTGGDGSTGTVNMITAPASGETLVIERDTTTTQLIDFVDNDPFPAETAEQGFDRAMLVVQEIVGQFNRTLRQPVGDTADIGRLPAKADRLGKFLFFNATTGDPEAQAGTTEVPVSSFWEAVLDDLTLSASLASLGFSSDMQAFLKTANDAAARTALGVRNNIDLKDIADLNPSEGNRFIFDGANIVLDDAPLGSYRNRLLNGNFAVAQDSTSFTAGTNVVNNDDTYLLDQWILLSDGNDIVDVSQETTTVPANGLSAIKLDIETANKKAGIFQPIEQTNCFDLVGRTATLSFKARKGGSNTTVDKLRAAVVAWDSTADSITSDIVSAWNAEGADPTLVANWTYENTPSDLTLTDSYQTFTISGVSIDTSGAKNVGVFIWIDNDDGTVGDLVFITDVQLERGAVATEFEVRDIQDEESRCLRYYETSYNTGTPPASASTSGAVQVTGTAASANQIPGPRFSVSKRVSPSVSIYSTGGALGSVSNVSGTDVGSSVSPTGIGQNGVRAIVDNASPFAVAQYSYHYVADARL